MRFQNKGIFTIILYLIFLLVFLCCFVLWFNEGRVAHVSLLKVIIVVHVLLFSATLFSCCRLDEHQMIKDELEFTILKGKLDCGYAHCCFKANIEFGNIGIGT